MPKHFKATFALLASTIACGPPGLAGNDSGADSTDDESSGSESATTMTDPDPTGAEAEGSEATTLEFVPHHDVNDVSCDPWAQDCPEGEKCVPYASSGGTWDANKCVPVVGDGAVGELCTYAGPVEAVDDCDATGICWNVDEEGHGICTAFCTGTPDWPECAEGSFCLTSGSGIFNLCIPNCDPLIQDCATGQACFWTGNMFECVVSSREIPPGQPCGFINDCAIGLACIDASVLPDCAGSSCCTSFCDLDLGDAQCEMLLPGTSCVAFFEQGMAPTNYETVGICITP